MNILVDPKQVKRALVLGAGTIGASWAAYFTWRGLQVQMVDPHVSPKVAGTAVTRNLAVLRHLGSPTREGRYQCTSRLEAANPKVDFVQEAIAEDLAAKQRLLAQLESWLNPSTIVCSSTSALLPSDIQANCQYPERVLVGHPFNPPHLLPLVEVVAGCRTAPEAVTWALQFYQHVGKHAIRVKKEVKGHIANRLTSALFREAVHLLSEGIATAEEVDAAVTYGPGLRWALMGPFLTYHLAGGAAGIEGYLAHLGDSHPARWAQLGTPRLDAEIRETIIRNVLQAYGDQSGAALSRHRDRGLMDLLRLQHAHRQAWPAASTPPLDGKS